VVIDTLMVSATHEVDPGLIAPPLDVEPMSTHAMAGLAVTYRERFAMRTRGVAPAFFDMTDTVCQVTRRSGVKEGLVLISMAHTTCAIIVQENEPLVLADLADRLNRFAAYDEWYRHNQMHIRTVNVCGPDECANGHSHCQHALLGSSVTLPVGGGDVMLGTWQRVLLVELDHPRTREMTIQVMGTAPAPDSQEKNAGRTTG